MRKIIVTEFVTANGIMEDPDGIENSRHGGWAEPYLDDAIKQFKFYEMFRSGGLLLGRITYQALAAHWPSKNDTEGLARWINSVPKYVVSTTLKQAAWNNTRLIGANAIEEIEGLKQQRGHDILVAGSGTLVNSLMRHDLIDEYRLLTCPVVLGTGKRLFRDGSATRLTLADSHAFSSGAVLLCYKPHKNASHGNTPDARRRST